MPDKIFKKNAKVDAASIVMGGGPALPYKAKKNMFQVPTNYGTASRPLYKKEAMSSPIPRTTEITSTQTQSAPVEHGDGGTYSGTLYSYYTDQGIDMPSWQERGATYEQLNLGSAKDYKGTSAQNKAMYNKLTTDTHKVVKDKDGNIKNVSSSGADLEADGINVDYTNTKDHLVKGSNITDVSEITDDDIRITNERGEFRSENIGRRHSRRAERQWRKGRKQELREEGATRGEARKQVRGEEYVPTQVNTPAAGPAAPLGGSAAVLGQTSGAGSSMAVQKKKKYYEKKKK